MGTITAQIQLTEAELKLLQTLVYQECGMFFDERRSHFLKIVCKRPPQGLSARFLLRLLRLLTSREGRAELALLSKPEPSTKPVSFRNRRLPVRRGDLAS